MHIDKVANGNTLELIVSGRLESVSAPMLDTEIKNLDASVTELVLDLTNMDYTSSAGLRVILTAHKLLKSRGGIMKLRNVNDSVKKLFDLTAFTPFLNFI